jgi:hypothetical protein
MVGPMIGDMLTRLATNIADRISGPMMFRFVFQPAMAVWLGFRDGRADAAAGRPPYFWALLTRRGERAALLHQGWRALARVLVFGVVMDVTYQLYMFQWLYPLELIVTVLGIVCLPYLLVRGPVSRFLRLRYLGAAPTRRTRTVRP